MNEFGETLSQPPQLVAFWLHIGTNICTMWWIPKIWDGIMLEVDAGLQCWPPLHLGILLWNQFEFPSSAGVTWYSPWQGYQYTFAYHACLPLDPPWWKYSWAGPSNYQPPGWSDSCLWLWCCSQLKGFCVTSSRNPHCCITMRTRPQCLWWISQVFYYFG